MKTKAYAIHLTGAEITLIVAALGESRYEGSSELAKEIIERTTGRAINRVCACGVKHPYVPSNAKLQLSNAFDDPLDGWYWNCVCNTTMFEAYLK